MDLFPRRVCASESLRHGESAPRRVCATESLRHGESAPRRVCASESLRLGESSPRRVCSRRVCLQLALAATERTEAALLSWGRCDQSWWYEFALKPGTMSFSSRTLLTMSCCRCLVDDVLHGETLVVSFYVCAYVSACVRTPIHRRTRRTILAGSDHGESSLDFPT
ncbi:hypothetical protein LSAT2_022794 [Lamellibrachia satsuma]|nr:hypothetical protein LSAT2_022794 [Lamellibrachia satsuma]